MEILSRLLSGNEDNHMYPFFWQHGETNEKILEYIDRIQEGGIQNLCIESRPHPDYLNEGWWNTLDFIVAEAKRRDMKIWILDDAKFPTGYANGKVPNNLQKKYIYSRCYDVIGTSKSLELNLNIPAGREIISNRKHATDEVYKVIIVEKDISNSTYINGTEKDITSNYCKGILTLELDKKHYSVFVICKTICGQEDVTKDYLDPTRKEATVILLDEVYEKHYLRYSEEFGKTITAFFSDEPRFGNAKGTNHVIGKSDMPLPWNDEISIILSEKYELQSIDYPYLFINSEKGNEVQFAYMDVVSQLYSDNFSQVIGAWCESHSVMYVGHVIEDNNAHARLGYGPGHYFRAMKGQHMAGIDIIAGQITPGMNYQHDAFPIGGNDGEFYHYALCRLGASEAKLDAKKNGRLMCEAFGAYGWIEGLKMMKWITDHMLSHGVNYIVPHAFSPKEFPDLDCPPHFYAHGNNPQYPYFQYWSNYSNRLCNLLSNGYQVSNIGVLYHAFNEWHGDTMLIQKVLKELQCNQIDSNIISEDYILSCNVEDNYILINNYQYDVLIIPETKYLPKVLNAKLNELSKNIKLIFTNSIPTNYCGNGECVALEKLSIRMNELGLKSISTSTNEPDLVYYQYCRDDGDVIMFTNENVLETIRTNIELDGIRDFMRYDAFSNKTFKVECKHIEGKTCLQLEIQPYESLVLVSGKTNTKAIKRGELLSTIDEEITISMKSYNEQYYQIVCSTNQMIDLSKDYPNFSGNIKYKFEVNTEETEVLMGISEAYEIIEVIVNDISCGVKICPEYIFDISSALIAGNNKIEIIATNNLGRNQKDLMSSYFAIEPLGIQSNIKLYKKVT